MCDVALDGTGVVPDAADVGPGGARPLITQTLLDGVLDDVVELDPAAGEELDAVVGHRVVAGGQHHAQVGVHGCGEVGDTGGGHHAEANHVHAGRGQPGHHRRLQELARGAGVASDYRTRPTALEHARLGQHVGGGDGEVEGQFGGQLGVGSASDTIGAEQARHAPISACCTAEPCGPSSDRPSCVPSPERRG